MRTTFDLPDDLMRKAKSYAATHGLKLKDFVAESIEQRLKYGTVQSATKSPLPKFKKAASTGAVIPNRTNAEMEMILDESER